MLVYARDVWSIIWVGLYFALTWWVWVSNAGTLYEPVSYTHLTLPTILLV